MSEKLSGLHSEILSEFETRISDNDEIPNTLVEELQEADNMGLDSAATIQDAIGVAMNDETE